MPLDSRAGALGPVLPATFGRYTLLERVGGGGMASVYRASLSAAGGFEKEVAVKVVRQELAEDPQFTQMFLDEARLSARLTHANIVQTFDFGQEDGVHFLAMELVRGRTLAALLRICKAKGIRLGQGPSLQIATELARGLGYAHRLAEPGGASLGIVHRDVSPQNVLVSREGEVKLADFGIAKAVMRSHVTQPGRVRGKCAYMAPEQIRGQELDGRADVFALGIILWECLTCKPLFDGPNDGAVLMQVLEKELLRPSWFASEVHPSVDELVMRMLSRDRAERPDSTQAARELADLTLRLVRSQAEIDLAELQRRLGSGTAVYDAIQVIDEAARVGESLPTRAERAGHAGSEGEVATIAELLRTDVPPPSGPEALSVVAAGAGEQARVPFDPRAETLVPGVSGLVEPTGAAEATTSPLVREGRVAEGTRRDRPAAGFVRRRGALLVAGAILAAIAGGAFFLRDAAHPLDASEASTAELGLVPPESGAGVAVEAEPRAEDDPKVDGLAIAGRMPGLDAQVAPEPEAESPGSDDETDDPESTSSLTPAEDAVPAVELAEPPPARESPPGPIRDTRANAPVERSGAGTSRDRKAASGPEKKPQQRGQAVLPEVPPLLGEIVLNSKVSGLTTVRIDSTPRIELALLGGSLPKLVQVEAGQRVVTFLLRPTSGSHERTCAVGLHVKPGKKHTLMLDEGGGVLELTGTSPFPIRCMDR